MKYINLGNEERPILFGMSCFRLVQQETGLSFSEVTAKLDGDEGALFLPEIVYHALRNGEEAVNREPGSYTPQKVAIWMDLSPESYKKATQLLIDSVSVMGGATAQDPEKKMKPRKPGTGPN